MDAAFMGLLCLTDKVSCTIRGAIIDHQNMERLAAFGNQRHHRIQHARNVLFLVVSRYDDEAVGHGGQYRLQGHSEQAQLFAVKHAPMSTGQIFLGEGA